MVGIGMRVVKVDLMGCRFRYIAMAEKVLLDRRHTDLATRHLCGKPIRQPHQIGRARVTTLVEPEEETPCLI